jgi:CRP-like cAMP-binding protein
MQTGIPNAGGSTGWGGRTLDLLTPGACFGEMAVIGRNRSRAADVIAQTASRVVSISGEALESASDVCRMHFYQAFLGVLTGRLAAANLRLTAA